LTVNATGLATYDTFNITDSAAGTAVTFGDSGVSTYADNFNVTLDGAGGLPGAVTFTGASSFTGANALAVITSAYITFSSGAVLSTVNGSLTLDANTQATPSSFNNHGVYVNNATVQATGTGVVTVRGRSGQGASTSYHGVFVASGGKIVGGTTGSLTVQGWGAGTGSAGNCGVYVYSSSGTAYSTISSLGASVSVTGNGGGQGTTTFGGYGVLVSSGGGITSGTGASVLVTGYGSTNVAATGDCMGVYVKGAGASSSYLSTITSGGGDVTVNGTGGILAGVSTAPNG
jgi:hypothetical protein